MGLEEHRRGNAGRGIQTGGVFFCPQIQRHHQVLVRGTAHLVQFLHQTGILPVVQQFLLKIFQVPSDAQGLPEGVLLVFHAAKENGGQEEEIGVVVENLIEEVAAVMGSQLRMPD